MKAQCPDCDVVLVTMCSVRRDYVDVYEDRGLTPNLSRIAAGGYHFGTAYAASNFTLASLTRGWMGAALPSIPGTRISNGTLTTESK